jgi:hypothetical protein
VEGFGEHGNELSDSIKKAAYCLTSWVTISFSKTILHHGAEFKDAPFKTSEKRKLSS